MSGCFPCLRDFWFAGNEESSQETPHFPSSPALASPTWPTFPISRISPTVPAVTSLPLSLQSIHKDFTHRNHRVATHRVATHTNADHRIANQRAPHKVLTPRKHTYTSTYRAYRRTRGNGKRESSSQYLPKPNPLLLQQGDKHALIIASSGSGIEAAKHDAVAHTVTWAKLGYQCWLCTEPRDHAWIQDRLQGKHRLPGRPLLDVSVPSGQWTFISDPFQDVLQPLSVAESIKGIKGIKGKEGNGKRLIVVLSSHASNGHWSVGHVRVSPAIFAEWFAPLADAANKGKELSLFLLIDTCSSRKVCNDRAMSLLGHKKLNASVAFSPLAANTDCFSTRFGFGGYLSTLLFDHLEESGHTLENFPFLELGYVDN